MQERNDVQLMIEEGNIRLISKNQFQPTNDCGFTLEFIPIPHRSELGDTSAILIKGPRKNLLFLSLIHI